MGTKLASLDDSFYGVVFTNHQGEQVRKYPMYNGELVKKAEGFFNESYQTLKPMIRKELAEKIALNAKRFSHKIKSAAVNTYASKKYSPELSLALDARKLFLEDKESKATLDKLARLHKTINPYRFAKALELFDKHAGLDKLYGKEIGDAYVSTFGLRQSGEYEIKIGGQLVTGDQIRKFADSSAVMDMFDILGKDVIDELKKYPVEIFDALPSPYQEAIADKIEEEGIA
jgi:hypothetical protein